MPQRTPSTSGGEHGEDGVSACTNVSSGEKEGLRNPNAGRAVVGPHIFFDELSKSMIPFKLGVADRG